MLQRNCLHTLTMHTNTYTNYMYAKFKNDISSILLTVYGLKQELAGLKLNEDYGDTVPSRPQNVGLVANEVPATSASRKQQILDDMEEGMSILLALC